MVKATIIGGGIAGLATALFAKQEGLDLPVYERQDSLRCQDNLLWMAPNGLKMLERLGVMDSVQRLATPQDGMIFADESLQTLMQMKGQALESHLGYRVLALSRQALYEVLLEALLQRGGQVHFGHELRQILQDHRGVQLEFANGEKVRTERVIAADGIGSLVRRQIFPESRVRYQGLRTYLGKSVSPVAAKFVGKTIEAWGHGVRFVVTSLDGTTAYWSAIERSEDYVSNSAPLPADLQQRLLKSYAKFHPDILTLIEAAVPESIHRCNFGVVEGLRSYMHGGVCLIGDAAHGMPPNMGQGASLGLEDAQHLVHLLLAGSGEFHVKSDRPRMKRAAQMRQLANAMNVSFQPKSLWASRLRNAVASLIPDRMNESRMVQLYQVPRFLNAQAKLEVRA